MSTLTDWLKRKLGLSTPHEIRTLAHEIETHRDINYERAKSARNTISDIHSRQAALEAQARLYELD